MGAGGSELYQMTEYDIPSDETSDSTIRSLFFYTEMQSINLRIRLRLIDNHT